MSTDDVTLGNARLLRCDCMEFMRGLPDKAFDLAIVDPPYGINFAKTHTGNGWVVRPSKDWDKSIPSPEYFTELFRVSKNQIIWGGNYFIHNLYPTMGWVFWDKGQRAFSLADGELACTSFDKTLRVFDFSRAKLNKERGDHPTQKPVKLYEWLLTNYAKPGQRIQDTHLGSMSSVIAALNLGFEITGCELDADYYAAGVARVRQAQEQPKLFTPAEAYTAPRMGTLL